MSLIFSSGIVLCARASDVVLKSARTRSTSAKSERGSRARPTANPNEENRGTTFISNMSVCSVSHLLYVARNIRANGLTTDRKQKKKKRQTSSQSCFSCSIDTGVELLSPIQQNRPREETTAGFFSPGRAPRPPRPNVFAGRGGAAGRFACRCNQAGRRMQRRDNQK